MEFKNLTPEDLKGYSYMTESFAQLLNNLPAEQRPMVRTLVEKQVAEYHRVSKIADPLSVAHAWHNAMDQAVAKMIKEGEEHGRKVSCAKGCGFCCYQKVDITKDEAILLNKHVEETGLILDQETLEQQGGCNNYKDHTKLDVKHRKCVFLDENMSCSVYEYRPASCRSVIAISDPEKCDTEKNPGGEIVRMNAILPEAYLVASHIATGDSGGMASMLTKYKLEKDE
jgi:Fe-S-cluster containining protein